jgi:DNA uptake protein ComE-like DNA-binding protein
MEPSNLTRRLKDLEDNIKQDSALLKEYEDELRYEDEPRRKAKYNRAIQQLRESANRYQQEYDQLDQQITGESTVQMHSVAIQLEQMNKRLDQLYVGQKAIYGNINHLRQRLLAHYEAGEKNIISAITNQLNESQVTTISALLDAIEANQVSDAEMQNILPSIQEGLIILQQRGVTLPVSQEEIVGVINEPQIDFKHRLKVAVPLIPFILDYEGELELGTGINLKEGLKQFMVRFIGG